VNFGEEEADANAAARRRIEELACRVAELDPRGEVRVHGSANVRLILDVGGERVPGGAELKLGQIAVVARGEHLSAAIDREALGRLVRDEWIAWAKEQPNPKRSWLLPWEELPEPDREVDRRIGERLARAVATIGIAARTR
jgi:hypothetical protein